MVSGQAVAVAFMSFGGRLWSIRFMFDFPVNPLAPTVSTGLLCKLFELATRIQPDRFQPFEAIRSGSRCQDYRAVNMPTAKDPLLKP